MGTNTVDANGATGQEREDETVSQVVMRFKGENSRGRRRWSSVGCAELFASGCRRHIGHGRESRVGRRIKSNVVGNQG